MAMRLVASTLALRRPRVVFPREACEGVLLGRQGARLVWHMADAMLE